MIAVRRVRVEIRHLVLAQDTSLTLFTGRPTGAEGTSRPTGAEGTSRPTGAEGTSRPTGAERADREAFVALDDPPPVGTLVAAYSEGEDVRALEVTQVVEVPEHDERRQRGCYARIVELEALERFGKAGTEHLSGGPQSGAPESESNRGTEMGLPAPVTVTDESQPIQVHTIADVSPSSYPEPVVEVLPPESFSAATPDASTPDAFTSTDDPVSVESPETTTVPDTARGSSTRRRRR